MPRVKASPKKCIKTNVQQPTNSWIFLLQGEPLELSEQHAGGKGTPDIVTLRHPKSNTANGKTSSGLFLFSSTNNSVQEILSFNENTKRCWLIDDATTRSDGKVHLSTPIDPIFLVLPYLKKYCTSHAVPLDQLLYDVEFPETERLLKSGGLKHLHQIADRKAYGGSGDDDNELIIAFKYNEEKTLAWLKRKVERVADVLKQKNVHVGGGSISATYVKSSTVNDESYTRYAHGIVSEYLTDDLSAKLLKNLNLTPVQEETYQQQQQSLKRKNGNVLTSPIASQQQQQHETKKMKLNDDEFGGNASLHGNNALDLSKPLEPKLKSFSSSLMPPQLSNKDRARAKAATGSKSIASFFKKT